MAGKPADGSESPGKGAKIMGLLVRLCYGLGLAGITTLLLAGIDLHMLDLRHALAPAALPALVLFVVCTALGGVAGMMSAGKSAGQAETANEVLAARLEGRMKTVEDRFSAYLGAEADAVKKERDDLAGQLDAIHRAEEERRKAEEQSRLEEFETLKQQNLELQEQLRLTGLAMANAVSESRATATAGEDAA